MPDGEKCCLFLVLIYFCEANSGCILGLGRATQDRSLSFPSVLNTGVYVRVSDVPKLERDETPLTELLIVVA